MVQSKFFSYKVKFLDIIEKFALGTPKISEISLGQSGFKAFQSRKN